MENFSNKEYRKMEGISASDLKRMAKSMEYWKYMKDNPGNGDNPALLFGRAYHKYCLEPYDFFEEFAIAPEVNKRTKAGKEELEQFKADNPNKDIISQDDFDTIIAMRDALYSTPYCKKLIYGEHERSFFWTDEETGIKCKCRPDSFGKIGTRNIIVDLKTCANAETEAFMRDAMKFGYDIQAAHYLDGMQTTYGDDFTFLFIAQEKTAPYSVNILEADEYFIQNGFEVRRSLLETYMRCVETDEYPGYMGFKSESEINSLSLPIWLKKAMGGE